MAQFNSISAEKLARLIGLPGRPAIIDVRRDEDFAADPRLVPGSVRREAECFGVWAPVLKGRSAIIVCHDGQALAPGVAAMLRSDGVSAETLEGGAFAWAQAGHVMVPEAVLPARDEAGRTRWVTRARPKVDRVACPWLIRRFVDPDAVFLFVAPADVAAVAQSFRAVPFDVQGAGEMWSHEAERCSFDAMVAGFGLASLQPLQRLATIVRGADTGQLDLAPESTGLLAVSLGLSRMYADDAEQLQAGLGIYDAFYRWCRDATGETHDWASHPPSKSTVIG